MYMQLIHTHIMHAHEKLCVQLQLTDICSLLARSITNAKYCLVCPKCLFPSCNSNCMCISHVYKFVVARFTHHM